MNYEEALLMPAAKEEQERLTNQQAIILGSLLGGTSGAIGASEIIEFSAVLISLKTL